MDSIVIATGNQLCPTEHTCEEMQRKRFILKTHQELGTPQSPFVWQEHKGLMRVLHERKTSTVNTSSFSIKFYALVSTKSVFIYNLHSTSSLFSYFCFLRPLCEFQLVFALLNVLEGSLPFVYPPMSLCPVLNVQGPRATNGVKSTVLRGS